MQKELREFVAGALALGPGWWVWMALLIMANGVLPLFFLPQLTAIVTLVASAACLPIALALTRLFGYSKLLGLMHAPWVPMLVVSCYFHPGLEDLDAYGWWLTFSIATTIGSLIIDTTDVVRFLRAHERAKSE